ncbi:hypothetical protein DUNSADRAFT_4637 [Dunaliella salina]|uniref:Fe2OG dioxygenase domain-containing protein n=1 Tax=Dunaliella salina TaxID=3046 RepID=A0ABQ7GRP4_DUNSA|nr:hypothetical protein DUNSADRAFT_4637 [Dunaliella salina]|eukprot:KAF5837246.1 hypothetical protein DUNSADRAFT_4637 [Dunaliella salina]
MGGRQRHVDWLNNYSKASKWAARYDVIKSLRKGKGLCKFSNFLPDDVAHGIKQDLLDSDQSCWMPTEAEQDYSQNNISHSFKSTKRAKNLEAVSRVLSLLLPESLHVFSAAKYTGSDHIAPHDDRAYTQVLLEDGQIITCSRDIAVIVYLSPNWSKEQGGVLLDLEAKPGAQREYVPEFNSAIVFRIPRWHEVTPVQSNSPRLTIFGWFLVPGHKYSLNTGPQPETGKSEAQHLDPHSGKQKEKANGNVQGAGATPGSSGSCCMRPPPSRGGKALQEKGDDGSGASEDGKHAGFIITSKQQANSRSQLEKSASGDGDSRQQGDSSRKEKKRRVSNGTAQHDRDDPPAWQPGDGSILRLLPRE